MNTIFTSLVFSVLAFAESRAGTAAKTLNDIHTLFIEPMPDNLDRYIRAEITKQFKGRLTVVLIQDDADAVLTGVGEYDKGVTHRITGRYLGLHDTATGSVSLVDKDRKVVLWSTEAGDRSIIVGSLKRGGPRKVADRIVHNLKNAM